MLDNLVAYAKEVSALCDGNALLSSVVFRKDSWHEPLINPQNIDDCMEFLLTKLFV